MQPQHPLVRDGIPIMEDIGRWQLLANWSIPPLLYCLLCLAFIPAGFPLFHFLIELGAIVIGIMSLVVAAVAIRYHQSSFHLVAASGLGWSALIDIFHVATYSGTLLLPADDLNLPTQLWLAARFLQAGSLLTALLLMTKPLKFSRVNLVMGIYCLLIATLIIYGQFPDALLEESGLTTFKISAEYLIILVFLVSATLMHAHRGKFRDETYRGVMAAVIAMTLSEVCFTQYASVFDLINGIGHIAKFAAYWFLFQALVHTTIESPFKSQFELNFLLRERVKELKGLSDIATVRDVAKLNITQVLNDVTVQLP